MVYWAGCGLALAGWQQAFGVALAAADKAVAIVALLVAGVADAPGRVARGRALLFDLP